MEFIKKYNFAIIILLFAVSSIIMFLDTDFLNTLVFFNIKITILIGYFCILIGFFSLIHGLIQKHYRIIIGLTILSIYFIEFQLDLTEEYKQFFINIWFILYMIIYIIYLDREYKSNEFFRFFYNFIKPFGAYQNTIFWTILFVLILPIIFVNIFSPFITELGGEKDKVDILAIVFGFWLAIISTLIGIRVLIEIKYKPIHDFKEFSVSTLRFLENIQDNDEVNIIMPTLYMGRFSDNKEIIELSNKIERNLIRILNNDSIKLNIAIKEYDIGKLEKFSKLKLTDDDKAVHTIIENYQELKDNCPLSAFHAHFNMKDFNKISIEKKKIFQDFTKFMIKLHDQCKNSSNLNNHILTLKDYFLRCENSGRFFLFSNLTEGEHYFGIINEIEAQERINFNPSHVENKKLPRTFKRLFDNYIEDKNHS